MFLRTLLLALLTTGCAASVTDLQVPSNTKLLLGGPGNAVPVTRLIEARGFKGNDSTGPLLAAIVRKAGDSKVIACPGVNVVAGQSSISVLSSLEDKKKQAEELAALAESIGKILKNIAAIPFTVRSEMMSEKTVLCLVADQPAKPPGPSILQAPK